MSLRTLLAVFSITLLTPQSAEPYMALLRQGAESAEVPNSFDHYGERLATGDFNGDGYDDLIIGTSGRFGDNDGSGIGYVIFGGDVPRTVTQTGTDSADVLTGTTNVDVLIGGQDDDILIGNGGADVLHGGEGDDILAVSDLSFARLVGGSGNDTLRLDTAGLTFNLASIPDNRITGIEAIDITGLGANTLILNLLEVLNQIGRAHV